jgi:hypothetical protein
MGVTRRGRARRGIVRREVSEREHEREHSVGVGWVELEVRFGKGGPWYGYVEGVRMRDQWAESWSSLNSRVVRRADESDVDAEAAENRMRNQ